jgi:SAM-dependent methyltransferase
VQAYNRGFSRAYNRKWIQFARRFAPKIQAIYEGTGLGAYNRALLDVCCGTGQLAVHFAEQGYTVVGIDLSEHMLAHARENAAPYVEQGQVRFIQADAARFELEEQVGLAVSTFDALNHLPDEGALRSCFQSVYAALAPGGAFIFDLNTIAGLDRWLGIQVQDDEETTIITRGLFDDERGRAWTRITGFIRREDGLYERFEQTAYNLLVELDWVREALLEIGWEEVALRGENLEPVEDPKQEKRAFFIAYKGA